MPAHRRAVAVAAVGALVMSLAACTTSKFALPDSGKRSLKVAATLEPPTLDPSVNDAASISQVQLYNVYETLVKVDGTGQVRPLLAQHWEVSPDGKRYTFSLQPNAKFASGRSVTPDDVRWSIDRVKEKGTASQKAQQAVVEKVESAGDKGVVVTLSRPSNGWLYSMTSRAGVVFDSKANVDLAKDSAGSGPYQIERWSEGQSIELSRNPNYWGTNPRFDQVTFTYITDADAMNSALVAGDVDIISNVQAPASLNMFKDESKFEVQTGTTNGEVVLGFNHKTPALANLKIRQAITHAINRKALLDSVWNGKGTLIGSMVPPTDPWYQDLANAYPYDPAKAKALIAESGVPAPKLRLRLPTTAYATGAGKVVASQLADVGIEVVSDQMDFARWYDQVFTKGDYDMTIVAHIEPRDIDKFADPAYYWHYDNAAFAAKIAAADAGPAGDYVQRMREASTMLSDDAAACWLFLLPNLVASKADVQGVQANATSLSFDLSAITARGHS